MHTLKKNGLRSREFVPNIKWNQKNRKRKKKRKNGCDISVFAADATV